MDRYVTRVQRNAGEYPEGNQMIAFSATTTSTGNNITMPENVFYGANVTDVSNVNVQVMGTPRIVRPHVQPYPPNVIQTQGQIASGIDPRYLAVYSDSNPAYAQTMLVPNMPPSMAFNTFGSDYQNRNFIGAQTNKQNINNHINNPNYPNFNAGQSINNNNFNTAENNGNFNVAQLAQNFNKGNFNKTKTNKFYNEGNNNNLNKAQVNNQNLNNKENNQNINRTETNIPNFNAAEINSKNLKATEVMTSKQQISQPISKETRKKSENDLLKQEPPNQVKTRAEKLKELQKTGTRVFSGSVENILKWHKSLQDIGVLVMYEIVGKCVNVRAGEACAKNLVVRDENGPAIQVVYYEIDFFLLELKPPCTVRVIGRMMPGTHRFQAFNVRLATGDDVATLPRRAAVAAHHVSKLCKEYGVEVLVLK